MPAAATVRCAGGSAPNRFCIALCGYQPRSWATHLPVQHCLGFGDGTAYAMGKPTGVAQPRVLVVLNVHVVASRARARRHSRPPCARREQGAPPMAPRLKAADAGAWTIAAKDYSAGA